MLNHTTDNYKERKYFSTTRNYTLALLNGFNNVKYWVEDGDKQKEYTIPIAFGNYEKSIELADISDTSIKKGNFTFLPRLVLSFEGMTKAPDRQTNKYQKLSKRICKEHYSVDTSYNSVAYDYHFILLVQARGLTISSQIAEEILVKFNPSLNLKINEFPIFDNLTETQILISDPEFEIIPDFEATDVNIVNVSFNLTVRGNIYSPIDVSGPIKTVKMFTNIWDERNYKDSKLASYYKFDVDENISSIVSSTTRIFDGTDKRDASVEKEERYVIQERPDYNKYQIEQTHTPVNQNKPCSDTQETENQGTPDE